jgi:transcriptional regulator with XRE-family HTH domain
MDVPQGNARFDLRAERLNAGLTVSGLALKVGVSREAIRRLENGDGGAHPANLKLIADHFGVKVTDVLAFMDDAA